MILEITPRAKADIVDIFQYSKATWGIGKARTYANDMRRRMKALAAGTLSGQQADEIATGLRRQVSGAHVIWFRRDAGRVRIIRILHQSRDAGQWGAEG